MADPIVDQCGTWVTSVPKAVIEREAREAHAAGLTPNEGCRYPFHSHRAMHWLATYNLCMPLPSYAKPKGKVP
ncbi:hypothetical protein [Delftia sp. WSY_7]|uniref:hypothetical protein n=1 Tax=Delftia sp. WSY_7 TaxID=3367202 RepID=UPI003709F29C